MASIDCSQIAPQFAKIFLHLRVKYILSGDLTLIGRTQKWGFSCKVQRRPPADIFLNKSLPPKTLLRTPCLWPPWPWFSREKSLMIFKVFRKQYETLTLTLKICILQKNSFKELTLVLFESVLHGRQILFYLFGQTIYCSTEKP